MVKSKSRKSNISNPDAKKLKTHKCRRCGDEFFTKEEMNTHITQMHLTKIAIEELRLLEEGFIPNETKHGMAFKGRNRIIVA